MRLPRIALRRPSAAAVAGYTIIAPAVFFLIVLFFGPILTITLFSATDWQLGAKTFSWIGFGNYIELWNDRGFWTSLRNTFVYVAVVAPVSIALGLLVALLIESAPSARNFYRAIYFLPVASTMVAMAVVWEFIMHPTAGLMNLSLGFVGLEGHNWLTDRDLVLFAICWIGIWENVGYVMILFMAGLKGIPRDLYDAAEVDGANSAWDRFRTVTWPMLGPATMFVVIITGVRSFKVFDTVAVLTQGGPVKASEVLLYTIYTEGFTYFRTAYASSLTIIFLGALLIFTLVQAKVYDRRINYDLGLLESTGGRGSGRKPSVPFTVLRHILLLAGGAVMFAPFLWMLLTSLKPPHEIFSTELQFLPETWYVVENYTKAMFTPFTKVSMFRFLFNGVIICGGILILQIPISAACAYALAKLNFRGKNFLFGCVLFGILIPSQVTAIPLYILLWYIGLLDTYWALILPFSVSVFAIFLFRQFFMTVPNELLDAARLDGMSEFGVLWRVVLPAAVPAIVAFSIFSVVFHWNDLFWPMIVVTSQEIAPPPLGVVFFRNEELGSDYGGLMAAAVIISAPLLLAFLFAQKTFIDGISLAGIRR